MTELEQFIIKNHMVDGDINIDDSDETLRDTVSLMIYDKFSDVTELVDQLMDSGAFKQLAASIVLNHSNKLALLCEVTLIAKKNLIAEIESKINDIDPNECEGDKVDREYQMQKAIKQ